MDAPLLCLTALHLSSMLPMPGIFWRLRGYANAMARQPGCLRAHRWLSRRSLLVMSWWRDRSALDAWLAGSEHQRLLDWAKARPKVDAWVEVFQLTDAPYRQGKGGTPQP